MPAQPASQPWVGRLARNTVALQNGRTVSNRTPPATSNIIPAQGAKRVEPNIKFFASLSFKKATEVQGEKPCSPKASRKK